MGEFLSCWREALAEQSPGAFATVVQGPQIGGKSVVAPENHVGTAGNEDLNRAMVEAARGMLEGGRTDMLHLGPQE